MPLIKFMGHDGSVREIEAAEGQSVMRAAVDHDVPGIVADCGGAMSCATCHIYIPPEWEALLDPATADEQAMLEIALDPQPNSRLACQVVVTGKLDGLVVRLPESQF